MEAVLTTISPAIANPALSMLPISVSMKELIYLIQKKSSILVTQIRLPLIIVSSLSDGQTTTNHVIIP